MIEGTPLATIPATPESMPVPIPERTPYTPSLGERFADAYCDPTAKIQAICVKMGVGFRTFQYWMKHQPHFREMIEGTHQMRAMLLEEEAMKAVHCDDGKDDVPGARLRFDAAMALAAVNNPNKYGKKTVVEGNSDKPIVFRVVTGVPAPAAHQGPVQLAADGTVIKDVVAEVVEREEG